MLSQEFLDIFEGFSYTKKNKRTVAEYKASIQMLCNFCQKDFLKLEEKDIDAYYKFLIEKVNAKELSKKTVKSRFSAYSAFTKYMQKVYPFMEYGNPYEEYIKELGQANEDVKIQRIPSLDEADKILTTIKKDEQLFLIVSIVLRMGLSVSQICSLKTESIIYTDDNTMFLHFIKNGRDKLLPVPEDIRDLIVHFVSKGVSADGYLFHNEWLNPITPRNLDYMLKNTYKEAGINYTASFKDIRNRAILELLHAGVPGNEVAKYTTISNLRISQIMSSADIIERNPADMTNIRIVRE